jgi:NDP-sugar pyrophosphorylase family protein
VKKQIVILAGGLGTRLRPITEKIPKPLVPVAGQPFLHWQLLDLKKQGYTDVLLLVAYLGEQIEKYFGDGRDMGLRIRYSFEPEPLGTGGALKHAVRSLAEEFILLNGDSFLRAPLDAMTAAFAAGGFDAMISVYDDRVPTQVIPNLKTSGHVVLDYKKDAGREQGFDKIDSGVYVMKRSLLESAGGVGANGVGLSPSGADLPRKFALADLWPALLAKGRLGAYDVPERFYDIGTPARLQEFEEKVRDYFPNSVSN